jgi:hypothetical protein
VRGEKNSLLHAEKELLLGYEAALRVTDTQDACLLPCDIHGSCWGLVRQGLGLATALPAVLSSFPTGRTLEQAGVKHWPSAERCACRECKT